MKRGLIHLRIPRDYSSDMNGYLTRILSDFQKSLDISEQECKIRSLSFEEDHLPDYKDENVQRLYLLRYFYAYAFSYYYIFKKDIDLSSVQNIKITSWGCGVNVDYFGIRFATPYNTGIEYVGIDLIDWNDKYKAWKDDKVDFIQADFLDYLKTLEVLDSDLYVFPMSISELNDETIEQMCLLMSKLENRKSRFYFIFTLRSTLDKERPGRFKAMFEANGYSVSMDHLFDYAKDVGRDPYINEVFDSISNGEVLYFPGQVFDYVRNCHMKCFDRIPVCRDMEKCKKQLNWDPISHMNYLKYQVYEFTRIDKE